MSFLPTFFSLLFMGVAIYGIYMKLLVFFLTGAIGLMAIFLNLTTSNSVLKWLSYWAIFGASLYGVYAATQKFF